MKRAAEKIGREYNPRAAQRAIESARRYQGRVSSGEARMIHAILRGRG